MPPFALGRPRWDNWLLYRARARGAALVDATSRVTAVHQNHDYAHSPQGWAGVWEGPEAARNEDLMGGHDHYFTIADATHELTGQRVRWRGRKDMRRRFEHFAALRPRTRILVRSLLWLADRSHGARRLVGATATRQDRRDQP